ncbi:hypothetical protein QEG98_00110 [Myxococcus sp. MxC21-1]|uniref:hypothetical protein n=1 Tax=Myxococcus sp. MxC21-1 TaxID=3041439 RepID=UPI00293135DB|nr:hypothetical protein [Myxococcus sp. MxC21-1]WNZ62303.1 hypothetical protein QEG98_00110 [Myxococcus sp. MxC21-1]
MLAFLQRVQPRRLQVRKPEALQLRGGRRGAQAVHTRVHRGARRAGHHHIRGGHRAAQLLGEVLPTGVPSRVLNAWKPHSGSSNPFTTASSPARRGSVLRQRGTPSEEKAISNEGAPDASGAPVFSVGAKAT